MHIHPSLSTLLVARRYPLRSPNAESLASLAHRPPPNSPAHGTCSFPVNSCYAPLPYTVQAGPLAHQRSALCIDNSDELTAPCCMFNRHMVMFRLAGCLCMDQSLWGVG